MNSFTSIIRITLCLVFLGFGIGTDILAGGMKAATDKTNDGASFKLDRAPVQMFPDQILPPSPTPGITQTFVPHTRAGMALSPGLMIAQTTYDMQSGAAGGRRVAVDPFLYFVYLVWTRQTNGEFFGDRGVSFAGHDLTTEDIFVENATGTEYAGLAAAAVQPGGGLAFSCNARNLDPDSIFCWRYYYDDQPGLFLFLNETPDTIRQTLWPQISTHDAAYPGVTENVIYVLAHDYPDGDDVYLCRKVGDADWEPGVFMATTTDISYTIAADPNSDRVAMVYTDDRGGLADGEGGQNDLDVYYRLSEDQGASWSDPINVSNYTIDSLWRAYADVSALWTGDGVLHIAWAAREVINQNEYYHYRSRLMHWSSDAQKVSIVDEARYATNYGGSECDPGAWALYITDPTLAQCDNNLYALYTKYGDDNEPGALSDCSDNGFANGELYLAASDDGGLSWDTSGNITRTRTPGCVAGDCESDAWASMAPYGIPHGDESIPDTLGIVYINDRDAGAIPYGEGSWTLNNVMYLRLPCRDVPHVPRVGLKPEEFPAYSTQVYEGDSLILPLIIDNIGNGMLNISDIRAEYQDSSGWIAFGAYASNVSAQEAETLLVMFNSGATLTGYGPGYARICDAEIIITSDAPISEDTIPVHLAVYSDPSEYQYCENLTASTKTLRVCNTGRLSNDNEGASLDIPGDCDADLDHPNADLYLYGASPMIAYRQNDSNVAYTAMYNQIPAEPGTFKMRSPLTFTSVAGVKEYNMAVCTLTTTDYVFGVNMTVVAPTDGNDFVYVIYEFYPLTSPNDFNEVYVGLIADWDIPSDDGIKNGSGYDAGSTPPIIWQRGAETASIDEDPPHDCPILENDRYGGIALFTGGVRNAWTARNAGMMYGSGLNPDSLYDRMSGQTGYSIYSGVGADSVADLHTGITFARIDMSSGATYTAVAALITTNRGLTDLYDQAVGANAWAMDWPFPPPCYCQPGNADGSGAVDIGDAVYLINFIFKSGPAPTPYEFCSGDPNGDCAVNIGDPVYLIGHIFRGGPAPVDCATWIQSCGAYR